MQRGLPQYVDPAAAVNQAKFNAVIDWARARAAARRKGVAVARPSHPHAMQPARPGRTRTAPPQLPDQYPFQGRYLAYLLFDTDGRRLPARGLRRAAGGAGARQRRGRGGRLAQQSLASPVWIAFHAVALVSVCFVAVRFFRLFPKAQPPRIGPVKPPPRPVIHADALRGLDRRHRRVRGDPRRGAVRMKHLLLRLEPLIWLLFGQGT